MDSGYNDAGNRRANMTGSTEILIIGGVVLLLFGATAIPRLARAIGKARREFKEGMKEGENEEPGGEKKAAEDPGENDENR